ncbi:hypothetical protein [Amphritea sp. HPY]|uniref:hypothetical protein n=1 Tax=Amphritea sp. HPY TaxID=3421652 RepID=UPI003D7DD3DB
MITKILITLLVIAGCYLYLKRRNQVARQPVRRPAVDSSSEALPMKLIATILLTVSVLGSASYLGYQWYDSHTLLEVRIVTPGSSAEVVYQVYKADLGDRSFTTVDGQTVRIAANERLEISRLQQ